MGTWVKAKAIIRFEVKGVSITRYPGDWVELGGQELRRRLAANEVEIPDRASNIAARELGRCGVFMLAPGYEREIKALRADVQGVAFFDSGLAVPPRDFLFLWNPAVNISGDAVLAGFSRLMGDEDGVPWDVLACLADNELTLADVGNEEERATTESKVGTLRLPVYRPGTLWVRTGAEGAMTMIGKLRAGLRADVHPGHAFIRALYPFPLATCTLGADWIARHAKIRT